MKRVEIDGTVKAVTPFDKIVMNFNDYVWQVADGAGAGAPA